MKVKDPYYSYDKRVNGMISLSFKHADKSTNQSVGNMKGERLEKELGITALEPKYDTQIAGALGAALFAKALLEKQKKAAGGI